MFKLYQLMIINNLMYEYLIFKFSEKNLQFLLIYLYLDFYLTIFIIIYKKHKKIQKKYEKINL